MLRKDGTHILYCMQHQHTKSDSTDEWIGSSMDYFGQYFTKGVKDEYHQCWQVHGIKRWIRRSTAIRALDQIMRSPETETHNFRIVKWTVEQKQTFETVMTEG